MARKEMAVMPILEFFDFFQIPWEFHEKFTRAKHAAKQYTEIYPTAPDIFDMPPIPALELFKYRGYEKWIKERRSELMKVLNYNYVKRRIMTPMQWTDADALYVAIEFSRFFAKTIQGKVSIPMEVQDIESFDVVDKQEIEGPPVKTEADIYKEYYMIPDPSDPSKKIKSSFEIPKVDPRGAQAAEPESDFEIIMEVEPEIDLKYHGEIAMWIGTLFTNKEKIKARVERGSVQLAKWLGPDFPTYNSFVNHMGFEIDAMNSQFDLNGRFLYEIDSALKNFEDNFIRVVGQPSKILLKRLNLTKNLRSALVGYSYTLKTPRLDKYFTKYEAPSKLYHLTQHRDDIIRLARMLPYGAHFISTIIAGIIKAAWE